MRKREAVREKAWQQISREGMERKKKKNCEFINSVYDVSVVSNIMPSLYQYYDIEM